MGQQEELYAFSQKADDLLTAEVKRRSETFGFDIWEFVQEVRQFPIVLWGHTTHHDDVSDMDDDDHYSLAIDSFDEGVKAGVAMASGKKLFWASMTDCDEYDGNHYFVFAGADEDDVLSKLKDLLDELYEADRKEAGYLPLNKKKKAAK